MYRIIYIGVILLLSASCEKCMQCSYTYTVTTIQQTVNGEEEVVTTYTGYLYDEDSLIYSEECIKGDETYNIETAYQLEAENTTLDNYNYTCTQQ